MKKKLIYILTVLIIAPFFLTGCDAMTTTETAPEEDHSSFLVTHSDDEVKREISNLDSTYNEVKAAVDGATAETAEATRGEITVLQANLDRLDKELTQAVAENKITQDIKKTYDTSIEDLRTKVNELNTTLEQKGL